MKCFFWDGGLGGNPGSVAGLCGVTWVLVLVTRSGLVLVVLATFFGG